jgi:hypothetical protein
MRTLLTRGVHSNAGRISTRRALITVVLAGVLVAAGAVPSMAQVATPTFDDLRAEAHRGEIVYITDQGGTKVKGRVVRISATSIDLLVNGGSRGWPASDVARITQRRGHGVLGAEVGLTVGVGLAALLVITDGECANYGSPNCASEDMAALLLIGGFLGGIGGGAGAAIGAAIRTERVLYAAPSPSAYVFSLRVAPGVIGLRTQLRF